MLKIAFIGLGHMGAPMARHLIKVGFILKVFDIVPAMIEAFEEQAAQTISKAVEDADIIFTMLQTGIQVQEVCLNASGIFNHAKKGALIIDCSSIDIPTTEKLHVFAKDRGFHMLDAPVSGGVAGAQAATLTIMVGGETEIFNRAKDILEKIGKRIVHVGKAGHGQAAKICNNLILGISMIAVSEGFNLAAKLGLDLKTFYEISAKASGQCWSMTSYCPAPNILENVPSSHDYEPGFMAKMMLKDLLLGVNAAEGVRASIPLGTAAAQLYTLFVDQGNGEKDFSAIINMLKDSLTEIRAIRD